MKPTSAALLFLTLFPPASDELAGIVDVFARLASDLAAGNASAFLAPFERAMPDYSKLERLVYALVDQAGVSCSIEIARDEGDARRRSVTLDWILEITARQPGSPVERRQQTIRCVLARRGKGWTITAIEPVAFFAPPRERR